MRKRHFVLSVVIFAASFALSAVIDVRNLAFPAKGTLSNPASSTVAAQNPSTPQFWEYRVVAKNIYRDNRADNDQELNALAAQGFEIFSVSTPRQDIGFYMVFVLRRPKQ